MGFLKGLLFALAGKYIQTAIDVVKVEIAMAIIRAIGGIRRLLIILSLWAFMLVLIAAGLVMIPVALCIYMPWAPETKLIVMLVFAALYIGLPLIALLTLLSERRWMQMFKVNDLIERVMRKQQG